MLGALALASACSGGSDTPRALPTLTATATPSATPVVVPSAAKAHTPFGAAAFVRFYYAQVNEAYGTANPDLLDGLSDSGCSTCAAFSRAIADMQGKRQHLEGLAVRVLSAEAPPEQNGIVAVDVFADAPARTLVDSTGAVLQRGQADPKYHVTVFLKRVTQGWVVRAVQRS